MYRQQNKIKISESISTGIDKLDTAAGGLHPGDLIIVAGRPSIGKTEFLLHLALHTADIGKTPVLIFSLESSAELLTKRLLGITSGVNTRLLDSGHLINDDESKLSRANELLSNLPIVIDDTPDTNINRIRDKARCFVTERESGIIAVDYLQLIRVDSGAISWDETIGKIVWELKEMATELNVPVIALSQVKRNADSRNGRKPQISDLLPSPEVVEPCADIILFMCPKGNEDADSATNEDVFFFDIAKNRRGPLNIAIPSGRGTGRAEE